MIVPDNATEADLGEEPDGFWTPIHEQVALWLEEFADDESE